MLIFNIDDFQDINLSELLGSAKKLEKELQGLKEELWQKEALLKEEIYKVKENTAREIEILKTQNLTEEEKESLIAEKQQKEKQQINILQKNYQEKIKIQKEEIQAIQKKLEAYDERTMAQAKKSEEVLLNYQKIHELQMEEQKDFYEKRLEQENNKSKAEIKKIKNFHEKYVDALILRYNPLFNTQALIDILEKEMPKEESLEQDLALENNFIDHFWAQEAIFTTEKIQKIKELSEDFYVLSQRLQEIPYINSVKPALIKIEEIAKLALEYYQESIIKTAQILKNQQELNKAYTQSFQYFLSLEKEDGIIVGSKENQYLVILNPRYNFIQEAEALVFRGNQEPIGKIKIKREKNIMIANIISIYGKKKINPFDKILLVLTNKKEEPTAKNENLNLQEEKKVEKEEEEQ